MKDPGDTRDVSRRTFVAFAGLTGASLWTPTLARAGQAGRPMATPEGKTEEEEEEEVAPPEDLMREHGVLKRVVLVYGEATRRIDAKQDLAPDPLRDSARIIRTFIEDYHETPALREVVSKQEFGALGEEFEKKEHALFGDDGFEKMVDRVASIEKALGIYDLAQFTPQV